MPRSPSSRTPDPQPQHDVTDATRNERQKTMLLKEAGRLQRDQVQALIEESKSVVAESKKLCRESQDLLRGGRPNDPRVRRSA